MKRLFKQFSFPGGIPSHVAPETPGSIHEGGELGYALSHAYGAAFDNPDLIVACVVGDGEAETGPLATSWHSNKFLNPVRDGAVLPILHLNGYKIANPTVLARIRHEELEQLMRGYGYEPHFVEGDDPTTMHQLMAATLDDGDRRDPAHPATTRGANGVSKRPRWPMIVLRTPKGWTGPKEIDGKRDGGLLALAPGADGRDAGQSRARAHPRELDEELPARGAVRRDRPADARTRRARAEGRAADERQPARQRRRPAARAAAAGLPRLRRRGPRARRGDGRGDARHGELSARRDEAEPRSAQLPPLQPGREQLEPLAGRARGDEPRLGRRDLPLRRPSRARRPGHGDAERAPVPGLARGVSAHRPARLLLLLRGLHPHHRLDVQPARQVAEGDAGDIPWRRPIASLNYLLSSHVWRQDHNGFTHQDPGFIDHRGEQEGRGRPRLPAARRELPAVGDRPLPAQPELRQRHRRRQAARAAVAEHGPGDQALHAPASASGSGRATTRAASRTS